MLLHFRCWQRRFFYACIILIFVAPAHAMPVAANAFSALSRFAQIGLNMNVPSAKDAVVQSDAHLQTLCLASALYHEARGESREGQKAVAQVILNRVKSDAYPDTLCGVIYENAHKRNACQFSYACDGLSDFPREQKAFTDLYALAREATKNGIYATGLEPKSGDADQMRKSQITHYHTKAVRPAWGRKLERVATIGSHIFYRSERAAKSL